MLLLFLLDDDDDDADTNDKEEEDIIVVVVGSREEYRVCVFISHLTCLRLIKVTGFPTGEMHYPHYKRRGFYL